VHITAMAPAISTTTGYSRSGNVTASTTASTAALSSLEREIIFATEFYFKPEGVKMLKQRLERELGRKRLVSTFSLSKVYTILSIVLHLKRR